MFQGTLTQNSSHILDSKHSSLSRKSCDMKRLPPVVGVTSDASSAHLVTSSSHKGSKSPSKSGSHSRKGSKSPTKFTQAHAIPLKHERIIQTHMLIDSSVMLAPHDALKHAHDRHPPKRHRTRSPRRSLSPRSTSPKRHSKSEGSELKSSKRREKHDVRRRSSSEERRSHRRDRSKSPKRLPSSPPTSSQPPPPQQPPSKAERATSPILVATVQQEDQAKVVVKPLPSSEVIASKVADELARLSASCGDQGNDERGMSRISENTDTVTGTVSEGTVSSDLAKYIDADLL